MPYVVGQVPIGVTEEVLEQYTQEGFRINGGHRNWWFRLPVRSQFPDGSKTFLLPTNQQRLTISLRAAEEGGAYEPNSHHPGTATIVASSDGRPLEAISQMRVRAPNGEHALFAVSNRLVTVKAQQGSEEVAVLLWQMRQDAYTVAMHCRTIYEGAAANAPPQYAKAVRAARRKAEHIGCREAHYWVPPRFLARAAQQVRDRGDRPIQVVRGLGAHLPHRHRNHE